MYRKAFPNLARDGYEIESEPTSRYNCIAWAAGNTDRWWWPSDPAYFSYWPPNVKRIETIQGFVEAFQELGYELGDNENYETGTEKVAIYANDNGEPTHMARQLSSGDWTSKLGHDHDIRHHTLQGLEGETYGHVSTILKRKSQR